MVSLADFKLICVQFRCASEKAIPLSLRKEEENWQEKTQRINRSPSGKIIIESVEDCAVWNLPDILSGAGKNLIDAFCQERNGHYITRFTFSPEEIGQKNFNSQFREMCNNSFWRLCAYLNPFYKDGEEIQGAQSLSLNLTARRPRFYPDGNPIFVWRKDGKGERMGNFPIPLEPKHCLCDVKGFLGVS